MPLEIPDGWELLISAEEIEGKLLELANSVAGDFKGKEIVIIGLLESARWIVEDLQIFFEELGVIVSIYWLGVNSYDGDIGEKSETHNLWRDLNDDEKKEIKAKADALKLLVDDMVDGGKTMLFAIHLLQQLGLSDDEIKTLVLLKKTETTVFDPDYFGFDEIDQWVAGRGINGNSPKALGTEDGRNLPFIIYKK